MPVNIRFPDYAFNDYIHVLFSEKFFFLSGFSFTNIRDSQDSRGRRRVSFFLSNSSLPLPLASQILRHEPGDYCRGLTSAHS